MKKLLAVAALSLTALALSLSTAWAQNYQPQNFISTDRQVVQRNQPIRVDACCFLSNTFVQYIGSSTPRVVGNDQADANGFSTITFTVPADFENGTHTVNARGTGRDGQPLSLTTTFTVTGGGGLIPTGSQTLPWVLVGLGTVVVGGTFVGFARRRNRGSA